MNISGVPVLAQDQIERAQRLADLVIATSDQELAAISGLTFIQSILRNLERSRKEQVTPLNDEVGLINNSFKILNEPFKQAEIHLKGALLNWRQAETKRIYDEQFRVLTENVERERKAREAEELVRQQAEEEALKEAAAAGLNEAEAKEWAEEVVNNVPAVQFTQEQVPVAQPTTVKGTLGSATLRTTWDFEVKDETQVPRAYLMVDESKIRIAVRAGIRDVPGIKIFQIQSISGRRTH